MPGFASRDQIIQAQTNGQTWRADWSKNFNPTAAAVANEWHTLFRGNGNPRNRRVRIIMNVGHLHYVHVNDILHRSERIIRLVDMLENANIRTELIAAYSSSCSHTEITVKRFDESLVVEDVAVVTHPDFPRRIMFRLSEHSDTWSYGYGQSTYLNEGVEDFKSKFNDELTIYIEGNIEGDDINNKFEALEKELEEELSEEIPTKSLIRIGQTPHSFSQFLF